MTQGEQSSDGETQNFYLNYYGLPSDTLKHSLNQRPPHKASIACWRIQPESGWVSFSKQPEVWARSTAPVLDILRVNESASLLQVGFLLPPHEKTRHGVNTSELALMVKIESLQSEGGVIGNVYMLWSKPDNEFSVSPAHEPPKD